MRLVCNISMLGERPTGLGVYADKCLSYLAQRYELDYISGGWNPYPGRVVVRAPDAVAIGGGIKAAVRRQKWASSVVLPDSALLYSPTHHGIGGAKRQVLTIHDLICLRFPFQHLPQYAYFKWVLPSVLRRTEALIAVSETTKADVSETYGYPKDRIFVVPNSVDRSEFEPRRTGSVNVGGKPYLLMVGARYPHKNVDEVFDFSELWSEKYRLVIASCTGKYRDHLEKRVDSLGLRGKVQFLDYISFNDLVCLYQNAAALIYPSKWEGFGIPPLEALASGCRVVLSDIPVHREVFDGSCEFVRLGVRESWATAFDSLALPVSRDMAEKVESVLQKYTPTRTGEALVRALASMDPGLRSLAATTR